MPAISRRGEVQLTDEQHAAISRLLTFPGPVQTLGGYAGTGKTTLIRYLKKQLPDFAVCAFTGKAAHVLRRKKVGASTIHSLIYESVKETYYDALGKLQTRWVFRLISRHKLFAQGIIVDESSMVSQRIYNDLLSFGVPLIFVGDHGQLEPVGDKFNLMDNPDITLETIHRNAGEIAHFAEFIRKGNRPGDWRKVRAKSKNRPQGRRVRFLSEEQAFDQLNNVASYDQIIVAFNKLRVAINQVFRDLVLGRKGDLPVVGDRVMCLQNNSTLGVFNGMQGLVGALGDENEMRFDADGGGNIGLSMFLNSLMRQSARSLKGVANGYRLITAMRSPVTNRRAMSSIGYLCTNSIVRRGIMLVGLIRLHRVLVCDSIGSCDVMKIIGRERTSGGSCKMASGCPLANLNSRPSQRAH